MDDILMSVTVRQIALQPVSCLPSVDVMWTSGSDGIGGNQCVALSRCSAKIGVRTKEWRAAKANNLSKANQTAPRRDADSRTTLKSRRGKVQQLKRWQAVTWAVERHRRAKYGVAAHMLKRGMA